MRQKYDYEKWEQGLQLRRQKRHEQEREKEEKRRMKEEEEELKKQEEEAGDILLKVIYDYDGLEEHKISAKAGEVLIWRETKDENWVWAEKKGGE